MSGRGARLCVGVFLAIATFVAATLPAAAERLVLFGNDELGSTNITLFPQWTAALDRQVAEPGVWNAAFSSLHGASARDRIRAVNEAVNRVSYVEDAVNWGVADYWTTPAEFYASGGDCEDYAIAKYMALRHLGFAAADLRIVVVLDERRRQNHAVLAVATGNDVLILDNLRRAPVSARRIHHYSPFYSINELGWWLH